MENKKDLTEVPKSIIENIDIIPVKNVDEVLKVALTKPLKRIEWVEVEQISNKDKYKEEVLEGLGESEAVKSHALLFDTNNKVRVYYHPENGLVITLGDGVQAKPFMQIKNDGEINLITEANNILVETDQVVEIKCDRAYVNSPNIELGETALEQVIKGNTFQALFNTHTHVGNLGSPTTPPVVPLTGTELSQVTKTQ